MADKIKNDNNNGEQQSPPPPPYSPIPPNAPEPSRSTQQPQYRAIVIEQRETPVVIPNRETQRQFPVAALFFIFGFLCPFFWIVGACCCAGSWQPYEAWWGNANMLMSIVFIMASLIYTAVMFATGHVHV
ncbi:hypothetical protein BDB00DRAFT_815627 [Zychaea mexicana]|uniref:uncharacterized protein n=1 Tax=Zychaea mexicana TaxID=64656 RepID=UPI0022FE72E4|nr:uncharacterized protein BDB00DRAFT_815627 [Zychaea mexicana]KAI9495047.1 hypothetical protein BDB00DRAFT_815627 [Zychaea mexicana]